MSHPIRVGEVEFHRVDKPNVVFGSVQLKRVQFPLELCVATTIHDIQGTTAQRIATHGDANWRPLIWSRLMLFTLLTRVQRLSDITICNFDRGIVRASLQHRTAWHKEVDAWLVVANVLPQYVGAHMNVDMEEVCEALDVMGGERFFEGLVMELPPMHTFLPYVTQSAKRKGLYVGWTDNMADRLRNHNRGKCTMTMHNRYWELKAYVYGFC